MLIKASGILRSSAALLILLAAPPAGLEAQQRPMRFEHLTIDDGLSQNTVTVILQDRTGFLWLGTQSGLNRYDGYGFEVYRSKPDDPATLGSEFVVALNEDPSGDLWIGTEGGGLDRWRRATDTFVYYRHDPEDPRSLSSDRVSVVTRDRSGNLWVGTFESGLNRLEITRPQGAGTPPQNPPGVLPTPEPSSAAFRRFRHDADDPTSLADDRVRAIHEDRRGNLWIATLGGLSRWDPRSDRVAGDRVAGDRVAGDRVADGAFVRYRHDPADPASLSDDRVRAIAEDAAGDLWIGTERGGLNRLPGGEGDRFERFRHDPAIRGSLSHDWVRTLFTDRDGRLWIGTEGGLNLWQPHSAGASPGRFASYRHDPADPASLSSDQVVAIAQDRGGLLWVGTLGGGVNKWNPGSWSFGHEPGDPSAAGGKSLNVLAISEDPEGGLWVGSYGGGLERLDRTTGERTVYRHDATDPRSLGDDRVTTLAHDREGALWIGTLSGGLHRLDRRAGDRFERFLHDPDRPESLSANAVTTLYLDRRDRLWVGTYGGGLNLHLGGGAFRRYRHDPEDPQSLSHDRPISIAEDGDGLLWVATDGGGLNRFHPVTEAFLRIRRDRADPGSLPSDELTAVHVDPEARLWVGTKGGGLGKLERVDEVQGRGLFKNYSRADGLPDETLWGIRSDASGSLWLATNKGLSRFNPDNGTFKNYNAGHGLQSNEFNLGAHYRSSSGELFFGGVNGFNAFDPETIEANPHVPPVVLTSFTKINEPVRFGRPIFDVERIALSHRDYSFSFELAALDFTAPGHNRYRYRLEGFHDRWLDNDTRRWVSFTNLDPGRYLLRVQGSNNDGVWNEQGAQIRIDVAPPPWRTWWAYALYALGLASALAGARAAHRQRRQAERDREIAEHQRAIAQRDRQQMAERERLIEERERLAEEREHLAERQELLLGEIADYNAQLEKKNAELERFNYTVTHDLKSPLVTVKGFLGMLQRDLGRDDRERVEHDIRRVMTAADKMQTLLEELLDLSQVSDPKHLARQEVSLSELAAEAVDLVEGLTVESGAEIEIDPRLPVVMGDPVRLLQVYQNLLTNAIRYMGDQPSPRIEVGVRRGGEAAVFFVRDNGVGIDPRFHDQIFELFERLDATREGTGVGLAVVKRVVELHGGRIWVESEGEGHGSTFCFTLGDAAPEDGGETWGGRRPTV